MDCQDLVPFLPLTGKFWPRPRVGPLALNEQITVFMFRIYFSSLIFLFKARPSAGQGSTGCNYRYKTKNEASQSTKTYLYLIFIYFY